MLINYIVVAFISLLLPVVIFLIIIKRKSIEQDSIIKNFEQKIDKLVDDHNHALGDAKNCLKQKEEELRSNQDILVEAQEEMKKLKRSIQALVRYEGIVNIDKVIENYTNCNFPALLIVTCM